MFPIRKLVASAAVSLTAVGLSALVSASPAAADVLPNSTTVHLGDYPVPPAGTASYDVNAPLLPETDGVLGRPTRIAMTGDASLGTNNQVLQGDNDWAYAEVDTQPAAPHSAVPPANQTWYFQRVGYVGVINPSVNPDYPSRLATPVYRIVHYPGRGAQCLTAYGTTATGTAVSTLDCAYNDTNQLWLVGSPGRRNNIIDANTGAFTPGASAYQFYSPALQSPFVAATQDYQHSVIENLASVAANGWDVTKASVLSAGVTNANGTYSRLELRGQTQAPANSSNSTWNVVAG